tara:strand:- start:122 stop:751 length:630 start_codon:yes stop_codon:yes gene_type:complete
MELKVKIPKRMQDITLNQYQRFMKECGDESLSEDIIALKMLEIFCGVPVSDSYKLRMSDVYNVCDGINKALKETPSLINRWKYVDQEFGFIPQLDDMTFGEYVDLDKYIKDWDNMHKAMAVLYRPVLTSVNGKYDIEEYKGDSYWELMKQMPLNVVMSSMLFFWTLENDLVKVMIRSLKPEEKATYLKKRRSMLDMVGITQFGDLQKKT